MSKDPLGKIKFIQPKVVWGGRSLSLNNPNLVSVGDNEFVTPVGNGLLTFENSNLHNRKFKIVDSPDLDVISIDNIVASKDCKFLAASAKVNGDFRNEINILIYHTTNHFRDITKPRHIHYQVDNLPFTKNFDGFKIKTLAFSHDSNFIGCATNYLPCGILIFEQYKGQLFQSISIDSQPISLSFNPLDPFKVLLTGENNLIKFWRFSAKSVHMAGVVGLRKGSFSYTCHEWLPPYSESTIVVGSDAGFLSTIQNCEQRAPAHQVFGTADKLVPSKFSIQHILVRGDNVVVASPENAIVLFEVRRIVVSKGIAGLTATLAPLAYFKLENIERLYGLQFSYKDSITAYSMVATTNNSVISFDMITDADISGKNIRSKNDGKNEYEWGGIEWAIVKDYKKIYSFHSQGVQSLCLSSKNKIFLTSSYNDGSMRIWDYEDPTVFNSSFLIESFYDRAEETPFHVDFHPSGMMVACACESEVKEYVISDTQMDLTRVFNVRSPFISPTGIPIVISQPVSLVKYSNGGHLLAVVTGKVAQVFHLLIQDRDSTSTPENPFRIMSVCDHSAPITDLCFMRNDSKMITTASDGSVYSWNVGSNTRSKEFIYKGVSASRISISSYNQNSCTIIAIFDNNIADSMPLATEIVRKRRASNMAVRRQSNINTSLHEERNKETRSSSMDIAAAAAAFLNEFQKKNNPPIDQSKIKQSFIAVWTDDISNNPTLVTTEVPVCSVAMGKTNGPDGAELCILGLVNGCILITYLPLPLMQISNPIPTPVKTTAHATLLRSETGLNRKTRIGTLMSDAISETTDQYSAPPLMLRGLSKTIMKESNNDLNQGLETHRSGISTAMGNSVANNTVSNISATSAKATEDEMNHRYYPLNEDECRFIRLLVGSVTQIKFSLDGSWIFVAGEDGSVHMLSTIKKSNIQYLEDKTTQDLTLPNHFFMIEKSKMNTIRGKLTELEINLEQGKKENEMYLNKILEGKDKLYHEMETKLRKEIAKRDETILITRKEYLNLKKNLSEELSAMKKTCDHSLSEMELAYEKKLAQEALYLDKMKQAYDEYVVHTKMDLSRVHEEAENKITLVEQERIKAIAEAEKQKMAVLQYYDYIKERNDEVIQSLEEQQADERLKYKSTITQTNTMLADAQSKNMSSEVQASRTIQRLKMDIEHKELEIMRVNTDIDWANDRIKKLEQGLQQATVELKARTELNEKWEVKTGELQQKIEDLEKIRKTLTTQVHFLQSQLDPKERELQKVSEKLREIDREYEISLHAITEKEQVLGQKTENISLLQKQLRDLRTSVGQKDAALRRAAIFFDEFISAMHNARFAAKGNRVRLIEEGKNKESTDQPKKKKEDPAGETKEKERDRDNDPKSDKEKSKSRLYQRAASSDPYHLLTALNLDFEPDLKLKRLNDILKPYLVEDSVDAELIDEADAVRKEQERHVQLLHRNFNTLQNSIESTNALAASKVYNYLSDNQTLLKEVNDLRTEVRSLSLENSRLVAQLDFFNARRTEQQQLQTQLQQQINQLNNPSFQSLLLNSEDPEELNQKQKYLNPALLASIKAREDGNSTNKSTARSFTSDISIPNTVRNSIPKKAQTLTFSPSITDSIDSLELEKNYAQFNTFENRKSKSANANSQSIHLPKLMSSPIGSKKIIPTKLSDEEKPLIKSQSDFIGNKKNPISDKMMAKSLNNAESKTAEDKIAELIAMNDREIKTLNKK